MTQPVLTPNLQGKPIWSKQDLTQDQVQALFVYDAETGKLFWRQPRYAKQQYEEAGWNHNKGYRQVCINEQTYLVHRIIWLMFFGTHPEEIDHIDGDKQNNRLTNLRATTKSRNQHNSGPRKDSRTGIRGVGFNARLGKWHARIQVNKMRHHLGFFDTLEQAQDARENASKILNLTGELL
jgi:hypothetical protein